jgi:hypothetical protein
MDTKKHIKEELDSNMDWIEEVEADLIPGEKYIINSHNGIYWDVETFVGMGYTEHPTTGEKMMGYKFKSKNSTGWSSIESVRDRIDNGKIRPYSDWTIMDEIEESDTLDGIEGRDFAIYFNKGIEVNLTLPIQEELTKRGYNFYGKSNGEHITSDDTRKSVRMIECINWDTSDDRYMGMSPTQRDEKRLIFSEFTTDSLWHRGGDDKKHQKRILEEDLSIILHHKGILINGYNLLNNINKGLNEGIEKDWGWVSESTKYADNIIRIMGEYDLDGFKNVVITSQTPIDPIILERYVPIFIELGVDCSRLKSYLVSQSPFKGDMKTIWVEGDMTTTHHSQTLSHYVKYDTTDGGIEDGIQFEYYDDEEREYRIIDINELII